jgi:nucleoside-diphosphate-sugar epimerase
MQILVTGASGYVAKFVIEDLERDHDLVLFSRRHPREGQYGTQTQAPFIRGDLTVLEDCRRAVDGVDAIAHIGAVPEASPETFVSNTVGTYYLMEAAREAGVRRVVMASSNCVLGHCYHVTGRPFEVEYLPFDEAHPSSIEDTYGLSKLTNELTLATYTRAYGIECVALRLNWCWGPAEYRWRASGQFNPARHVAGFWAYVDMRDVAQAFRLALHASPSDPPAFGAYYISAADTMADQPSAELVARFYPQYRHLADKLEGHTTFFSWQAAQRAFGYTPQYSWRQ